MTEMKNITKCAGCGGKLPTGRTKYCTMQCRRTATNTLVTCRAEGCNTAWLERNSWADRGEHIYCNKHRAYRGSDLDAQPWTVYLVHNRKHGYGKVGITTHLKRRMKELGKDWEIFGITTSPLTQTDARKIEATILKNVKGEKNVAVTLRAGQGRHETFWWANQTNSGVNLLNTLRTLEKAATLQAA